MSRTLEYFCDYGSLASYLAWTQLPALARETGATLAFRPMTQRQDVKETLKAATEEAERRGAFGAPTMYVGDEMFFGQDRLDFVREALARQHTSTPSVRRLRGFQHVPRWRRRRWHLAPRRRCRPRRLYVWG